VKFAFVADRLALNFIATVSERRTRRVEQLASPSDLQDWIDLAGVVDACQSLSDAELQEAKRLREALFALIAAVTERREVPARDRDIVNAAAVMCPPTVTLISGDRVHRDGDLRSVLAVLARDGIDLVDSPDRDLVRWCADDACSRPFVDRSRGQRRRWCGMSGCGDRAKSAAYRRRQQTVPDGPQPQPRPRSK
jgi:predicted RNA-binding Zn ribbon-like protein